MAIKKSLGRGLGSLLSDSDDFLEAFEQRNLSSTAHIEIPIDNIMRNENQPRKSFDENSLSELVNSIRLHGVITPIIVVRHDDRFMIIAGERRWRAARLAGLTAIPAIVRNYTPLQIKEISLIENLQREDLNPIETAMAIKQLMLDYSYTQEQVAERIGKSRSAIANTLGLLSLDSRVIDLIASGKLSPGHAKILTSIEDKDAQYELALRGLEMTVRKFEQFVKTKRLGTTATVEKKTDLSLELQALVELMQRTLATKVSAIGNDNKGRIYIDYYTRDDLDRILFFLNVAQQKIN